MLLIRHAEAVISESQSPSSWRLSTAGVCDAEELGKRLRSRFAQDLDGVVASAERKAIETATALAGCAPIVDDRLGEVSKPWYHDPAEHRDDTVRYLRGRVLDGWEHQSEVLARFGAAVDGGGTRPNVIATHGTVMSLWLARQLPAFDPVAFWLDLRFPDAHVLTSAGASGDAPTLTRV